MHKNITVALVLMSGTCLVLADNPPQHGITYTQTTDGNSETYKNATTGYTYTKTYSNKDHSLEKEEYANTTTSVSTFVQYLPIKGGTQTKYHPEQDTYDKYKSAFEKLRDQYNGK